MSVSKKYFQLPLIVILITILMIFTIGCSPKVMNDTFIVPCDAPLFRINGDDLGKQVEESIVKCDSFLVIESATKYYDQVEWWKAKFYKIQIDSMSFYVLPEFIVEKSKYTPDYFTDVTSSRSNGNATSYKTGKRGGQYYINSKGNKTYKKK